MLGIDDIDELAQDVGVLLLHIVVFVEVGGEVVQLGYSAAHYELPVVAAHGHDVGFAQLPVEVWV